MNDEHLAVALGSVFGIKHVLFRDFDTSPLGIDLNKTEERVLMMSWLRGRVPMQTLSREVGLEKGSLTTVVDALEGKGLLSRTRDESDKRSFIISPTSVGTSQAVRIDALFREHLEIILGKLSQKDREEFELATRTLARIIPLLSS